MVQVQVKEATPSITIASWQKEEDSGVEADQMSGTVSLKLLLWVSIAVHWTLPGKRTAGDPASGSIRYEAAFFPVR